jgi:hypothetical protein
MELNEDRIVDFLEAAALRGPQVGTFVRDQVLKRFGSVAPSIRVNFVPTPKRNPDGTRVLEASDSATLVSGTYTCTGAKS